MPTKIPKISAKFLTTLAKRVNIGDTTATLSSIKDLDLDSLPSGRYGFTVDEGNSQIEYFEADLSGSALSNIKRLDPTTLVETTGFLKEHRAGAETKITDYTVLARIRAVILGEDDLDDGSPIKYGASPSLSDPLMLATVEYVLSVVNGGAVTFDAQVIVGDAGETISSGDWVYLKESDGQWYKTDANTQATVKNVKIGKALGAGTAGNAISGGIFVGGLEKTGTYSAGQLYYLSNTAGALSTTAGEFEALVGIGDANGELIFLNVYDPEGTTPDEKDALVGTVGTPNTDNKYVTENGSSASGTDQEQTTQDSSVELGEANATTKKNKIAQSFKPKKNKIRGVKLYKSANTGTAFTGTVTVTLQSDSSGSPDGVALATKVFTNLEWNTIAVGEMEAIFATEYTSMLNVPETTYWIVIESSTSDNSNHPNLGFNTAGGYSNGTLKYNNTTDGWVEITGDDLYFKTLEGNTNQNITSNPEGKLDGVIKKPTFNLFDTASSDMGGSTTQFYITNPSGTTFRYTWDSTGTDPNISATTVPIGSLVSLQAQNFASGNKGLFIVTGSGANYFEITNASGVAEVNKTIGTGYIAFSGTAFWTKSELLSYIQIKVQGGGAGGENASSYAGAGGGAGGYAEKYLDIGSIPNRIPYLVGKSVSAETSGRISAIAFGSTIVYANGGSAPSGQTGGAGGTGVNGDLNIQGGGGGSGNGDGADTDGSGKGGDSMLGRSSYGLGSDTSGPDGGNYGAGGTGGRENSGSQNGGAGAKGCVIIIEF